MEDQISFYGKLIQKSTEILGVEILFLFHCYISFDVKGKMRDSKALCRIQIRLTDAVNVD